MNKDKKQIVVLVSLVAVVGAVGAFQFMKKGPTVDVVAKVEEERPIVAATSELTVVNTMDMDALFGGTLEERDPFDPQAILLDDPRRGTRPPGGRLTNPPDPEITGSGGTGPVKPGPPNGGTGGGLEVGPSRPLGALSLRGVIIGPKPMAVFEGDYGRQILVGEGKRLPNGTVVLSIAEGKVILKRNGKISSIEFEEAYS